LLSSARFYFDHGEPVAAIPEVGITSESSGATG